MIHKTFSRIDLIKFQVDMIFARLCQSSITESSKKLIDQHSLEQLSFFVVRIDTDQHFRMVV